ncbi:MAG: PAS domain-containing protein [Fibrella sp.]|nr:PAS domain-containing protein [Armatimonadota bacterium]
MWVSAIRAGTISEVEYRLRHRDGEYRWHLGRSLPVRGEGGQIVAWVGTATDIQSRVAAEAQSRRAVRMLDTISDAYVTLDRDFIITYVNAEAARINKKPDAAFMGRLHWDE